MLKDHCDEKFFDILLKDNLIVTDANRFHMDINMQTPFVSQCHNMEIMNKNGHDHEKYDSVDRFLNMVIEKEDSVLKKHYFLTSALIMAGYR